MFQLPTEKMRNIMINEMSSKYHFLKISSIGKSWCGRDITCLRIGNTKKSVLWCASFHGTEWITSLVIFKFLNYICNSIKFKESIYGIDISKTMEKQGLTVIPCVNPDGVEISLTDGRAAKKFKKLVYEISSGKTSDWKSNARGVDINHNFNAGWEELKKLEISNGIIKPASTRYGGEKPESELETQALIKFCRENSFEYSIAFHSQGEEIYWKFGDNVPKKSKELANLFAITSGYTLSSPEGLAVGGGFKDWFIKEFNKPGFTIEIGKGVNPLPISDVDIIYNKIKNMFLISTLTIIT